MVVNRQKKVTKYRAHTTHGGGHRKKRRGAGSRGGRGNAGTGKRAGHKRRGVIQGGIKGFNPRRSSKDINSVNLSYFNLEKLSLLEKKGLISKEGDLFVIDLKKLGFDKILGTGNVVAKMKLFAGQYSAKAAEKVKLSGGEVISKIDQKEEISPKEEPVEKESADSK